MRGVGGRDEHGQSAAGGDSKDTSFDKALFSRSLRSVTFHSFLCLVLKLDAMPERLAGWCEGCACHEDLFREKQFKHQSRRRQVIELHFGKSHRRSCPLAGKRAPDLAAGYIEEVLSSLSHRGAMELISDVGHSLSADQLGELLQAWHGAIAHIKLCLTLKTGFWQQLPWVLCGLAHRDEPTAQRIARDIVDMLTRRPELIMHHRLSMPFLMGFREELEQFANGCRLRDLSEPFQVEVCKLRFVPVVETIIETKHAITTKARKKVGRSGAVIASLSNRLPLAEARLSVETGSVRPFFDLLLESFGAARHLGGAVS
eukprot:2119612-Pyramimonas_sp.AAC.1